MSITNFLMAFKEFISQVPKDLKTLNLIQRVLLVIFAFLMITFSIIDFNHFLDPINKPYLLKWQNDTFYQYEDWRKVIMTISGIASFTGVICVVLVSLGKISNYFWGILNCIFYGTFAFAYGYAGDAQLNLFFYLPLQFVGIYQWYKNKSLTQDVKVRKLDPLTFLALLGLLAGLIVMFYYEIPAFAIAVTGFYFYQDNPVALWLDVLSNSFSVIAQILLSYRYREQWIFWILVNLIQISMFAGVGGFGIDFNVLCMWSMFLINSFYGAYRWFSQQESEKESLELSEV